ncbi:MAG: cytidylate kinase [Bacillaceae bacterium G1]|nr:MAG: cytidylate kinase [Bacillaceae bacterium G1]
MKTIRVAIDGPAGAGKSTVAKQVAALLGMEYIDTGAMYRAVTWAIIHENIPLDDEPQLRAFLASLRLVVEHDADGRQRVWVNGQEVSEQIRSPQVTEFVSVVAARPAVRERLVDMQREIARHKCVIMDGRDIGTVVFPDAEVKFFITASLDVRAMRRYQELVARGHEIDYETVKQELHRRDELDQNRAHSPLKPAEDAIILDTSQMPLAEVVERVSETIRQAKRGEQSCIK